MSLRRIVLRDFVIVDELELDLEAGFTVLTGETGAGKSILIDALQLATGARADAGTVREGARRAEVSAEFDTTPVLAEALEAAGIDAGETVLFRRTVDTQGKSRGWINGSPATATQMRELGERMLDIHGQHAWQSLTKAEAMRGLLDAYARIDVAPLARAWQHWRDALRALADAREKRDSLLRERDRLGWQIGELDKLAPQTDEWEQISTEHTRLSHAQALLDAAQTAIDALQDGEGSAAAPLQTALAALQHQQHIEPAFQATAEVLASALAQIEDAAHDLRSYLRRTELDPQRIDELDQRMSLWMSLARRYKRRPDELAEQWAAWKDELARLDASSDLDALEAAAQQAEQGYQACARKVSAARQQAAPGLSQSITAAMQGLGMAGGRFEVSLQAGPHAMQHGLEDVGFLVAGHAGSSPRPVGKVASGGELSRIALAVAVTTSRLGSAQSLIFDEVDSGVGGAVAETVGRLLHQLGQDRQVLAVTHLPQVSACADHHLVVEKRLRSGVTTSAVRHVRGEARVTELARMLEGERALGTTLAHAREMLGLRESIAVEQDK